MSELLFGSICHTDYMEMLKSGNFEAVKAENGKVYVRVKVWINSQVDKYGNVASVQLEKKEQFREDKDINTYIGNLKRSEPKVKDTTPEDFEDDLEF